ncbi:MAG: hypothetical protein GX101_08870 [Firmicutes bacterium]|jgi:hypothetical protein|nr:hypothetical protein [Bacillota bacterium]NLO66777.1 hypothetical protein [Bacillota bacterium]
MEAIRSKINELIVSYQEQLNLYGQVREMGLQEKELIAEGRFSSLLEVLREKGELIKAAADYDEQIAAAQAYIADHLQLEAFSLPRLKQAVSDALGNELAALERVIADLVPTLETLEEQERSNEARLSEFLERTKDPAIQRWRQMRAERAYGRDRGK